MKTSAKIFTAICFLLSGNAYPQCYPYTMKDLDVNNVRARVINGSDKWWDLIGAPQYEVPKGSGKTSMFAAAIWIGGLDATGQLHLAAETYRQTGNDFWEGPVEKNGCVISTDTANCPTYQNIWEYTPADINNFISTGTATNDITTYPANGNVTAGELPVLAPFHDTNSNGIYEPSLGDYPLMDVNNTLPDSVEQLFGDQCLYWIFNDTSRAPTLGNGSPPMGVEIHAQAFSFTSPVDAVNNTTFYRYKIINRTCQTYHNVYISHWADADLGWYHDDYTGCNIGKNMGYCYNGDLIDDLPYGYGATPPAIGIKVLQGPPADANDGIDNNNNGVIDEPGEENLMTKFLVYSSTGGPVTGQPNTSQDYFNYMSGKWLNGDQWTYGGNGYNAVSTDTTSFIYPGDSDPNHPANPWDESIAGNPPDDRIFLLSSGPFTFYPDQCVCITYAVIWERAASGDNIASVDSLLSAADYINNNFHYWDCPCNTSVGMKQIAKQSSQLQISPNPANSIFTFTFISTIIQSIEIRLHNPLGSQVYFSKEETSAGKFSKEINVANLNNGIYFLQVKTKDGVFNKKVVVEH
ncbi:MAG: T9SS type A sorting domain-containing protein [Bacteroidota bacterium]